MRPTRLLLRLGIFLVAIIAVVIFLPRRGSAPAATPVPAPALPAAAPVDGPVLVTARAIRVTASGRGLAAAGPLLAEVKPEEAESGVLDPEGAAAAHKAIDELVATGDAEVLSSPMIMVRSGDPAQITVGSVPVPGAQPPTRRSLEVQVRPVARADGTIDLAASVLRKDVSGEVSIFLDDLGVPMGERRAKGDLSIALGSLGYLVRPLRDGSLLLVLLKPEIPPKPTPPPPTDGE